MNIKVSIIIPTYNYGAYIAEAINSVLHQTFESYEILVVDDGSTDNTQEVLARFSDHRLHIIRTSNSGVSSARNTGLERAKGELIAFLDADDRWLINKLADQVAAFDADDSIGFVFTNFIRFDQDGEYLEEQFTFAPELQKLRVSTINATNAFKIEGNALIKLLELSDMPWYPTSNMVRASLAKSERFSINRKVAEDVDYFLRIWSKTDSAYIPSVCAELRRHGNNATEKLTFNHNNNMIEVLTDICNLPLSREQNLAVRKRIGREWASMGHKNWINKRYIPALGPYLHALRYPGKRLNSLKHIFAIPIAICIKQLKIND